MRFSLGEGTKIASVHIELKEIRARDYKDSGLNKREWATDVAAQLARGKYFEAFGEPPKEDEGDPLNYHIVHTPDSVTYEIWQSGPETRRVNLKL